MVDVLTWTIERRMRLTERAESLRKELAELTPSWAGWRRLRWCSVSGPRRPTGDGGCRASWSRSVS